MKRIYELTDFGVSSVEHSVEQYKSMKAEFPVSNF